MFISSENQQVINDVVAGVLKGDGVGWFSQKKLRRLLIHESLRQYLFKQLYEPKEQSDEDEALHDIVRIAYRLSSLLLNVEVVQYVNLILNMLIYHNI